MQWMLRASFLGALGVPMLLEAGVYTALSAGWAALITTPFDVLGSRIMTQTKEQIRVKKGQLVWSGAGLASEVRYSPLLPMPQGMGITSNHHNTVSGDFDPSNSECGLIHQL